MLDMTKINEALKRTSDKLIALDMPTYDSLDKSLKTLTPWEIVQYQEIKSIAQAEAKIDLEVALWIYNAMKQWSKSPLADRVIITQLIALWTGAIHQ